VAWFYSPVDRPLGPLGDFGCEYGDEKRKSLIPAWSDHAFHSGLLVQKFLPVESELLYCVGNSADGSFWRTYRGFGSRALRRQWPVHSRSLTAQGKGV